MSEWHHRQSLCDTALPPWSVLLCSTPPHSHSIVPSDGSALIFQHKFSCARGRTVSTIRQKSARLISNEKFQRFSNLPVPATIDINGSIFRIHRACGASCRREKRPSLLRRRLRCSGPMLSPRCLPNLPSRIGIHRRYRQAAYRYQSVGSRSLCENDPVALIKKDRQRRRVQASVAARHPQAGRVSRCAGAQLSTTQILCADRRSREPGPRTSCHWEGRRRT